MQKVLQKSLPAALQCLSKSVRRSVAYCFDPVRKNFFSRQPAGEVRGRALVAHLVEGLLLAPDDPLLRTHNHFLEARLLVEAFLEQGYAVDCIDYRNGDFIPEQRYDVFICPRINFERLARRIPGNCIKIVHLDTAHWLYNNTAALRRLQDVQDRRGVALMSYAPINMNRAVEVADYATMLGNDVTYATYAFAGKQVFQIPNPATTLYAGIEDKDFAVQRNRFLWLGSRGLVHKGLDVTLEAFARMPDLHLTVCGAIDEDPNFVSAFRKELYETPNIHTFGWIDTTGPEFADLMIRTVAHVYPTCAEACCGAVVNCMHAGLIPVSTPQCGVDIDPSFGKVLPEPSVEAVMIAAQHIAGLSPAQLAAMARLSQVKAQRLYSAERYKEVLGAVIARIVNGHPDAMRPGFVRMEEVAPSVPDPSEAMPPRGHA